METISYYFDLFTSVLEGYGGIYLMHSNLNVLNIIFGVLLIIDSIKRYKLVRESYDAVMSGAFEEYVEATYNEMHKDDEE